MSTKKICIRIQKTLKTREEQKSQFNLKKKPLIKAYLRSNISYERLNRLTILSIEKDMLGKLEYKNLINNYASQKLEKLILNK